MYKKIATPFIIFFSFLASSFSFGMNITRSYDPFVRAERCSDSSFQFGLFGQASFSQAKGFDEDGCKVNILRIWSQDQNALKMLDGFDDTSDIGQVRIQVNANDDGIRGHFLVDGDMSTYNLACCARWCLPLNFSLVAHVPFHFMRLKDVCWYEKTGNVTADDRRTKQYLTDDFSSNVFELGGLSLGGWTRYGIGDISFILEWLQDFRQTKPFLKNVRINGRIGVDTPTGKPRDEDKLFALPFGNDRAVGLLFGGGLDLTFRDYLRAGLDVSLQHLFGNSRCRRVKTHKDQTEHLLLAKTDVFKEFGLSQQFSLYLQGYKLVGGLSATVGYQFYRHGDDTLCLSDHDFSQEIANTALSLEEYTMHNMIFRLSYDFECKQDRSYHPYIAAYAKIPFNGKYCAQQSSVGLVFSFDF